MKALLLILALTVGVSAQRSGSDLGINASYDKFKDVSTVKLTESLIPDRPGYVLFSVVAQIKGQDIEHTPPHSVVILITSFTDDWYFLKTNNTLRVLQDGQAYELGKMSREDSDVVRNGVLELLALEVPFSAIKKLGRASKLEIQVGKYESEIKANQIHNIKRWASWFATK